MEQKRRKFTSEFKLKVLQEALENVVEVTLRKHSTSGSIFYNWKTDTPIMEKLN